MQWVFAESVGVFTILVLCLISIYHTRVRFFAPNGEALFLCGLLHVRAQEVGVVHKRNVRPVTAPVVRAHTPVPIYSFCVY